MVSIAVSGLCCVAVAARNGSDGEWEGPATWRIVASAILAMPPPPTHSVATLLILGGYARK